MILRVHHAQIAIPPGEENSARAFYCGVLGLNEIEKPDALKGRGGLWLELGGFQVHLGTEDMMDRKPSKSHVAYLVENLDQWQRKLRDMNIEILAGIPIPDYRRFEFRDPFGNRVEFMERIENG